MAKQEIYVLFTKTFFPFVQQQLPAMLLFFVASRLFGCVPRISPGEQDDLHLNGEWQGWAWVHSATPGEVEQPLPAHLE